MIYHVMNFLTIVLAATKLLIQIADGHLSVIRSTAVIVSQDQNVGRRDSHMPPKIPSKVDAPASPGNLYRIHRPRP